MGRFSETPHWTRHIFYRSEHTRTTWKFRVGLVALVLFMVWLTRGWSSVAIAHSLICDASVAPSDAILVENFDPAFEAFVAAARLKRDGVAPRVLVPVTRSGGDSHADPVARGVAELMASLAGLGMIEVVPIGDVEPISLNAARDILRFMERERIRSVVIVSPLLRSRRSALVYGATLGAAGIAVTCEPVQDRDASTWTESWHGVQDVAEQWLKLQYYRFYVLPFRAARESQPDGRAILS